MTLGLSAAAFGGIVAAGGAVAGAAISANGAKSAANTQAGAAQAGIDAENAKFDKVQALLAPYVQAGSGTPGGGFDAAAYLRNNPDVAADPYYSLHPQEHYDTLGRNEGRAAPITQGTPGALGAYQNLVGLNGNDAQQTAINGIQGGAQFGSLSKQGEAAILANASATGGLRGGNTQNALATFRSNLLSSLIDKQLQQYGGLAQMGQNSAAGVGSAALTTGQGVAGLLGQQGAATAGGSIAAGNAITGALGGVTGLISGGIAGSPPGGALPSPALANTAVSAPSLTEGFGSGTVSGFAPQPRLF